MDEENKRAVVTSNTGKIRKINLFLSFEPTNEAISPYYLVPLNASSSSVHQQ